VAQHERCRSWNSTDYYDHVLTSQIDYGEPIAVTSEDDRIPTFGKLDNATDMDQNIKEKSLVIVNGFSPVKFLIGFRKIDLKFLQRLLRISPFLRVGKSMTKLKLSGTSVSWRINEA
jgi:hypothetical protein